MHIPEQNERRLRSRQGKNPLEAYLERKTAGGASEESKTLWKRRANSKNLIFGANGKQNFWARLQFVEQLKRIGCLTVEAFVAL